MSEIHLRRLKSFVLRQGRMTLGQQTAYDKLWSKYGIGTKLSDEETDTKIQRLQQIDFHTLFSQVQPTFLEVGFGMGDSLIEMAQNAPDKNFIGIEVHTPGVGRLLQRIEDLQLINLRVFHADAMEILEYVIPVNSLDGFFLFFPDPWHKRRHNKRRIVQSDFIELIYSRLKSNAIIHMATDWQEYAKHMLKIVNTTITESIENDTKTNISLINQSNEGTYVSRPSWRPETKFERKGLKKGHKIWDLLFLKKE